MNLDRRTEDYLILKETFDNIEFGQVRTLSPGPLGAIEFYKVLGIRKNDVTILLGYIDDLPKTIHAFCRSNGKLESFCDEELKQSSNEDIAFVYDVFTRKV